MRTPLSRNWRHMGEDPNQNHRLMAGVYHEIDKLVLLETADLIVLDKTRASRRAEVG